MADTDQAQSRSSFSHSTLVLRFFEKHSWRRELEEINMLQKKRDALSLLNPSLSGPNASTSINARNAGYVR